MKKKHEMTMWEPFRELDQLQERMRNLFINTGSGEFPLGASTEFADWSPAVDIAEDESEYTITADLPDVDADHLKLTLDDGRLTIRGEREHKEEEKKKKYHRVERTYGKYMRSFRLPDEVNSEKIDAKFDRGVLTIHLPKDMAKKQSHQEIAVH